MFMCSILFINIARVGAFSTAPEDYLTCFSMAAARKTRIFNFLTLLRRNPAGELEKKRTNGILLSQHSIGRNPGEPCEIHGLSRNCEPQRCGEPDPRSVQVPSAESGIVPETQDGEDFADRPFAAAFAGVPNGLRSVVFVAPVFRPKTERTAAWL